MNSINKAKVEDELKKLTAEYLKATHSEDKQLAKNIMPVSYTHLTLPTNREV